MADVIWIGVDVGKQTHHAAAVNADGSLVWSRQVPNDQAAIEDLIAQAGSGGAELRWAVDLTSAKAALLLALLVVAGQQVLYVPGQVVNRMAGAFGGEGKTDAKDAKTIAETARLRRDLTQLSAPDELVVELSLLTGHRADLMADWVRGINRLRELLTRVCPALERALDYSTRSALILVAGYCTPQAIRTAGKAGLTSCRLRHVFYMAAFSSLKPTAPPGSSTTANAPSGSATPKPPSPWPAAESTSCGHCCATTAPSAPTRRQPTPRLDTIIEIRPSRHVTTPGGRPGRPGRCGAGPRCRSRSRCSWPASGRGGPGAPR